MRLQLLQVGLQYIHEQHKRMSCTAEQCAVVRSLSCLLVQFLQASKCSVTHPCAHVQVLLLLGLYVML
jgi:hypothetical protein